MTEPKFMPCVATSPRWGALRAVGKVTGTHYTITPAGVWVWAEDLDGLLAEKRPVCCRLPNTPIQCFFLVAASQQTAHPYKPWMTMEIKLKPPDEQHEGFSRDDLIGEEHEVTLELKPWPTTEAEMEEFSELATPHKSKKAKTEAEPRPDEEQNMPQEDVEDSAYDKEV